MTAEGIFHNASCIFVSLENLKIRGKKARGSMEWQSYKKINVKIQNMLSQELLDAGIVLNCCKSYEEFGNNNYNNNNNNNNNNSSNMYILTDDEEHYGDLPTLSDLLISSAVNSPGDHWLCCLFFFFFFSRCFIIHLHCI